jgi:putative spermidine/putrescine transport system substrate-binding protein
VQYATSAEAQGRLSSTIAYGPTNAKAFEHIPEDMAAQLPSNPQYTAEMVFFDDEWWGEHQEAIGEQFAEWRLG